MIVEDDPLTREHLRAALALAPGLRLAASFDMLQPAQDWLARNTVDILLTDLGLPDGSGIDLIRFCHARQPECGVMVISMFGDEANVLASIRAGASGYILKDSAPIDVVDAVNTLRAGGSPMSPLIARKVLAQLRSTPSAAQPPGGVPVSDVTLTRKESETLDLIARGYTYAEIAGLLSVTVSTVQTHIKSIYGKLEVHSRGEAVFEAHKLGLLRQDLLGR